MQIVQAPQTEAQSNFGPSQPISSSHKNELIEGQYIDWYRVRDLLGKQADSSDVEALLTSYKLPYKVVPAADGRAAIKTDDNIVHPAEELVVGLSPPDSSLRSQR